MFGVAPGTSAKTNPNAMRALRTTPSSPTSRCAPTERPGGKGMAKRRADGECCRLAGSAWTQGLARAGGAPERALHRRARAVPEREPDARRSARASRSRRSSSAAGARSSHRWSTRPRAGTHGVYVGATMVSETTAAATGAVGVPRNDPMAMLPFCGYNMADYFAHWLAIGKRLRRVRRKIFHVNWFRRGPDGKFLWPGFGENVRVLKWIAERVRGEADAEQTVIGHVPTKASLDLAGLDLPEGNIEKLLEVDPRAWKDEAESQRAFLDTFGPRLPDALWREHEDPTARIRDAE